MVKRDVLLEIQKKEAEERGKSRELNKSPLELIGDLAKKINEEQRFPIRIEMMPVEETIPRDVVVLAMAAVQNDKHIGSDEIEAFADIIEQLTSKDPNSNVKYYFHVGHQNFEVECPSRNGKVSSRFVINVEDPSRVLWISGEKLIEHSKVLAINEGVCEDVKPEDLSRVTKNYNHDTFVDVGKRPSLLGNAFAEGVYERVDARVIERAKAIIDVAYVEWIKKSGLLNGKWNGNPDLQLRSSLIKLVADSELPKIEIEGARYNVNELLFEWDRASSYFYKPDRTVHMYCSLGGNLTKEIIFYPRDVENHEALATLLVTKLENAETGARKLIRRIEVGIGTIANVSLASGNIYNNWAPGVYADRGSASTIDRTRSR